MLLQKTFLPLCCAALAILPRSLAAGPDEELRAVAAALTNGAGANHPLRAAPVIDIHTHTFNAHFLPMEGIALGRRDKSPLLWLLWDEAARVAAAALVEQAARNEAAYAKSQSADERKQQAKAERDAAAAQGVRAVLERQAKATGRAVPGTNAILASTSFRAIQKVVKQPQELTWGEELWLKIFRGLMTHHAPRSRPVPVASGGGDTPRFTNSTAVDSVGKFIGRLVTANQHLPVIFQRDFGKQNIFMVSHMMDMAPTYDQTPDDEGFWSFVPKQINAMQAQQARTENRLAYFVAFNPFRDHWPAGARPGDALRLVQDAVRNRQAVGVKVYPPAGYRVFGNEIPDRPFAPLTGAPGRQWQARYTSGGAPVAGAELDARVLELLLWCASNQIPVFAHCNTGDMEARAGYGTMMADARWWRRLFEVEGARHPVLRELRLCLGHAGGEAYWFQAAPVRPVAAGRARVLLDDLARQRRDESEWGRDVMELCARYPNVYCEIGCLEGVLDLKTRARFALRMKELAARGLDRKILYGSDWFMPMDGDTHRAGNLEAYRTVFLLPELERSYVRFFLGNALDFLNARARLDDARHPLDPTVAGHFRELLRAAETWSNR